MTAVVRRLPVTGETRAAAELAELIDYARSHPLPKPVNVCRRCKGMGVIFMGRDSETGQPLDKDCPACGGYGDLPAPGGDAA